MGEFKKQQNQLFYRWTFEIIQKFSQKIKNFEIFFDAHIDTIVIVNNIKKNFKIFHFWAKFLLWGANRHFDEKYFCCKNFVLHKKLDGTNIRSGCVCVQKLVFSSEFGCLLIKTNF